MTLNKIRRELEKNITFTQAQAKRFFQTNKGDYAFNDRFLGVSVPNVRKVAKIFQNISFVELEQLLNSPFNEERFLALVILINNYKKSDALIKANIYNFYLQNIDSINNWNLVDISAYAILGDYLFKKEELAVSADFLLNLSLSNNLWHRRIAIVSTLAFIKNNYFDLTLNLATSLLNDSHHLIHKATGWMLRELGKRDEQQLIMFLKKNKSSMPSIMYSYATERLDKKIIANL